jgi:hypothetical protein
MIARTTQPTAIRPAHRHSYRSLKAAQEAWRQVVTASNWTPPQADQRSPSEILNAERWARDRDARNEYWHSGRRHV